jgi:5-methylcytosine-specific restriction endonuclease McrA
MTLDYQRQLFSKHAKDMRDVGATTEELFVCPICVDVRTREHLEAGYMDVGHVWPEYIRQKSELAQHQHVLLCKSCNSNAGKCADAAMQDVERIHELMRSGASRRPVAIRIFQPKRPDLKPVGSSW